MWRLLKSGNESSRSRDRKLTSAVKNITGLSPGNLALYRLATLHSSRATEVNGFKQSNERLEYLGDAILGAAVADYLFRKYPFKDEGFLTEIRSRIVNRESLNQLAHKIGLHEVVDYDSRNLQLQRVILGNTLEALVGAVYLDKGYLRTRKFVIDKLIQPYFNLDAVISSDTNFKSKIIEWAQRKGKQVRFEITETKRTRNQREFTAQVLVDDQPSGTGFGASKKKAEQDAAHKTCLVLGIE
ncbi:MAG: ribonuclease III [Bacteroidota bacterium]